MATSPVTLRRQRATGTPTTRDLNLVQDNVESALRSLQDSTRPESTDVAWTALSTLSPWLSYGTPYAVPGYRVLAGVVYLRGVVTAGMSGDPIANLPATAAPGASHVFAVAAHDTYGQVTISPSGVVMPNDLGGSWISLDGISFVVGG